MNEQENNKILKRILAHFEKNAPLIVKKSLESLYSDSPVYDFYDTDFYMSKLTRGFKRIDEEKLRKITSEHIDEISAIFFKFFKEVKYEKPLDFSILEKRSKRFTYIVFAVFLFISAVFLYFVEKYGESPLLIERIAGNSLNLKLSAVDVADFIDSIDTLKWISVKIIESPKIFFKAKLKHKPDSALDFLLNIDGTVYNLFKYENLRRDIYDFYKTAKNWGINSTRPELVQLKINEVLLGIYIMEEKIYEKLRDDKGNYYISLGSNTEQLNTMLYLLPRSKDKVLEKYFDKKALASYFIFFSLFCYNDVLDFDLLSFRYDVKKKKFKPYLTIDNVLSSLRLQNREFALHLGKKKNFFSKITRENVANLLKRVEQYKYKEMIKMIFKDESWKKTKTYPGVTL